MPIWVPQFSNSASVIELWNLEKSLRMNSESIIGKLTLKSLCSTIFLQWLVVVFWKWEKSCVLFFGSDWHALNLPGCMCNTFSEAWPNAGKIVNHTVDLFSHVEWISFRKTTRWNVSRKVPKITTTVINGRQPLKCFIGTIVRCNQTILFWIPTPNPKSMSVSRFRISAADDFSAISFRMQIWEMDFVKNELGTACNTQNDFS